MRQRLAGALVCAWLLAGCADPCANVVGEPTVTIAGSNDDGTNFELFDDGAERSLIQGAQLGMHVWLQVRLDGFCSDGVNIDRRVFDDTSGALLEIQRGPIRLTDGVSPGSLELEAPLAMQLCPSDQPIIGQTFRFQVSAEDAQAHADTAEKTFVARCDSGACGICAAP